MWAQCKQFLSKPRLLRFILGGLVTNLCFFGFFELIHKATGMRQVSLGIGYFCGFAVSLTVNKYFVFKDYSALNVRVPARFGMIYALSLVIQLLIADGLLNIGLHSFFAIFASGGAIAILNYLLLHFVFSEQGCR